MAERNKLSDKLRQEELLPEGYTWDQMEDGINARLRAADRPSLLTRIMRTLTIGIVSISLAAVVFYFTNNENPNQLTSENLELTKNSQINHADNKIRSNSTENSPIEKSTKNKNTTSITEVSGSNQVQQLSAGLDKAITNLPSTAHVETFRERESIAASGSIGSPASVKPAEVPKNKNAASQKNKEIKNSTTLPANLALNSEQNSTANFEEQSSNHSTPLNKQLPELTSSTIGSSAEPSVPQASTQVSNASYSQATKAAANTKINELQTLMTRGQQLFFSRPILSLPAELVSHKHIIQPSSRNTASSKFSTELTAGTNLWSITGATGSAAKKTAQSENALPGLSTNLSFAYALNHKWSIATGLGYRALSSKVSFEEVYDSTITENIVTLEVISPIDGSVLNEYRDDVDLSREVTYRLVHYNKYTRWSIPVIVRRTLRPDNNFNLFLGAGVSYGIAGSAEGKTLTDNPLDYRELQSSSLTVDQTHKLEAIVEVGFNLKLNQGISLSGRLVGNRNMSPLSYSEKIDKIILSSELGLRYRF